MVALKTAEIEAFVSHPPPARPIVLVFGPDSGLVRERAEAIIRASVDDPADPFMLARIEGDALAGDPTRLVEEASTIPLFGGRRAVWVRAGSRNIVPAVEALLAAASPDCRVVIEAGDLKRNSPLRVICERAKAAAAIACYTDTERDLARLIDDELRAAKLAITTDAKAILQALLGGDRLASRNEIRKVALYAHGKERIEVDDVMAVASDASLLAMDALVDAAFAGRPRELETEFVKTRAAATAPGTIVSAALRHVGQMHKAKLAVEQGAGTDEALRVFIPPIHFRRKADVESALRAWTPQRLARVMGQLADAVLEARRQPTLADSIAQRTMLAIATSARRKD